VVRQLTRCFAGDQVLHRASLKLSDRGSDVDDLSLVEAWRAGDHRAGEALFRRHFQAVTRFFRNKFSAGIDDLVQQTFVALLEGRERLTSGANFRRYLFGIAHNVMRVHLRALATQRAFDPTSSAIVDLDPSACSMVGHSQEQRLLLLALRRIPIEAQTILELVYWEQLNAAEIAEILGVPHSTMRSRIQRARQLLRDAIEQIGESPALIESTLSGLDDWALAVRKAEPV
jgi:RNA polymerase sigma factor (sigma-70 family)